MPTEYGQIYNQGVKYLKINRYDSGGLDRSDYLGQLTDLIINYNDLGSIQYNIITTQEQSEYFVYGIQTRNQVTESVNYKVLDYRLISSQSSFTFPGGTLVPLTASLTSTTDSLGYFNNSTSIYTLGNTPNIPLNLTISATSSNNLTDTYVIVYSNRNIPGSSITTPPISNPDYVYEIATLSIQSTILSGSTTVTVKDLLVNDKFLVGVSTGLGVGATVTKIALTVTQSTAANTNPLFVIFDPEFIDFDYNDYNALFGNAEIPQFSSQFMDVDYTSTFTSPVNFDLIISGTADRAQVQDSNYSSQAWSNIRYNGVRSNSSDFNRLTRNGGYGVLPNVEQNKTYMAYFDGVGGTGPEIIGQTAYFIKYLIDEQGNVVNPEPDTIALYNLLDSYEPGEKALIRLISSDPAQSSNPNDDSLTGLHPITHVGRISPILMSETGSKFSETSSVLYFDDFAQYSVISTPEYGFRAITTADTPIPHSNPEYTIICNLETLSSSDYNNGTGVYTFPSNTYTYYNRVNFTANGQIKGFFDYNAPIGSTYTVTVRIKKNGSIIAHQDVLFTKSNGFTPNYVESFNFNTGFQNFNIGDVITLTYDGFTTPGVSTTTGEPILLSGITFKAQNEYPAAPLTASAPYWTIGTYLTGNNVSVLTSSIDLVNYYDPSLYQSQSQAMLDWRFNQVSLAFQPQAGDFIRIEYNPDKVFNITKVEATDRLYLTVVPPIPTGSFLDHFALYRIINDGTYIILDVNKVQAGSSFTGIIQPQYVSQTLKTNYNDIIQNLTSKGLIS
jgi:hypothetical protein